MPTTEWLPSVTYYKYIIQLHPLKIAYLLNKYTLLLNYTYSETKSISESRVHIIVSTPNSNVQIFYGLHL